MGEKRRTRKTDRGAAAVEFAIVLPLFLTLVLGTIDFGYFLYVSEVVTNAAREGARAGSVADPNTGDPVGDADVAAKKYLEYANLNIPEVTVTPQLGSVQSPNDSIGVTVTYPARSLTGFLSAIFEYAFPAGTRQVTSVMRWL
ncbi:MAG: pilus assembly protein [Deltaproteobacteria bacterium]|nr:pilus assembly protein [Deltaproteobacteria bacterium]